MIVLNHVKGVGKVEFNKKDIVRHKLVQRIVDAYEKSEEKSKKATESKKIEREVEGADRRD